METMSVFGEERASTDRPHFSHSQINRYLLCPEQYRLYYREGLRPKVPSASLVFGNLIHQALASHFQEGADPVTGFTESWAMLDEAALRYGRNESWEKLNTVGQGLLTKFISEEAPKITAVHAVEAPFEISITDVHQPLVGVIDLKADAEGVATVVDFKTSASSYGIHESPLSDQLTAYHLAEPDAPHVALCVLVKTKEPKIEWHVTTRSEEDVSLYLEKLGYVAREIATDRFYRRTGMWCSWCDFLPVCLGDERKATDSLIKME